MKQMKRMLIAILMSMLVMAVLAACGSKTTGDKTEAPQQNEAVQGEQTNKTEETVASAFPVTFIDGDGVEITIEQHPERIVSLLPSNTEIVYALGAGDAIVGRSDYDNFPAEVVNIEPVGGLEINIEKILSLKPDVVLAHASGKWGWEEGLKQLSAAGLQVVMIPNETSFAEVYQSIEMISKVTGTQDKGKEIIAEMQATFAELAAKTSTIKEEDQALVWVEIDPTLFTTGQGTFIQEMLDTLHAKNVAGEQSGWVQYTEEEVIQLNPDVILITYGDYVENAVEQVYARPAWQTVNAIKNQRVLEVDPDAVTRTGPRLTKGMEELAKAIYPEIFAK